MERPSHLVQRVGQGVDGGAQRLAPHVKGGGGVCGAQGVVAQEAKIQVMLLTLSCKEQRTWQAEASVGREADSSGMVDCKAALINSIALPYAALQSFEQCRRSPPNPIKCASARHTPAKPRRAPSLSYPTQWPCWQRWAAGAACRTAGWCQRRPPSCRRLQWAGCGRSMQRGAAGCMSWHAHMHGTSSLRINKGLVAVAKGPCLAACSSCPLTSERVAHAAGRRVRTSPRS